MLIVSKTGRETSRASRQSGFYRRPEQWLAYKLLRFAVDIAGPHRSIRHFEHTRDGQQNEGSAGRDGVRRSRRDRRFFNEAAVKGAEPGELKV